MRRQVEWPTVALIGVVHSSWILALWAATRLPAPVAAALLGVAIAWHGSLQHELLHGHPFPSGRANDAVGFWPLMLRLPYAVYRDEHLAHHRDEVLTDPRDDCESFYLSGDRWESLPRVARALVVAHHTFLGRVVLGPAVVIVRFLCAHARRIVSGDRALARVWAAHLLGVAAVLWVALGVFGVPWWIYLIAVYVAHSIALVRSYLEHRWVEGDASRSATVRAAAPMSLLFLNNNLHDAHHQRPGAPWYELPRLSTELGADDRSARGAGWYRGYGEVVRRHLVRPFDHPVHPQERTSTGWADGIR